MKNRLLLCTALFAATIPFARAGDSVNADTVIPFTDRAFIQRGMTRETVLATFGVPSARLSADVWAYFEVDARQLVKLRINIANPKTGDTLIVAFKADRVDLIRLCDSQPVRAFLAQQTAKRAPTQVASVR